MRIYVGISAGVEVITCIVDEEVADVWEEVVIGEEVLRRCCAISSHPKTFPKNRIVPHSYKSTRGGVPKA
jgi:hypothetical protein